MTNLYFLHADGKETLVKENVSTDDAIKETAKYLEENHPKNEAGYFRTWMDDHKRFWIDVGSWAEFFIVREPSPNEKTSTECKAYEIN